MTRLLCVLLTLLFFLSGPAMGKNSDFCRSSLAAQEGVATAVPTTTTTTLSTFYPPNNGFLGATETKYLMPGDVIDRFGGSDWSRFFGKAGTPEAMRALPPGTAGQPLNTFVVMKPFPVDSGMIAPAFGEVGLGEQYVTPVILKTLLNVTSQIADVVFAELNT